MDLIAHLRTMLADFDRGIVGVANVEARCWEILLTRADLLAQAERLAARERALGIAPLPVPPAPAWWHALADIDA